MTEAASATGAKPKAPRVRIDWRTGKPMANHDDAFWQEHERRRVELGMSLPKYCAAHGLALSTYRLRVKGRNRTGEKKAAPSFVAITAAATQPCAANIEVVLQGMTMRLSGEAAERVLVRVMERLA